MHGTREQKWWLEGIVASLLLVGGSVVAAQEKQSATAKGQPPANAERLAWWRDARFGMFIHWGPVSLKGTEIGWSRGDQVPHRGIRQPLQAVQPDEVQRRRVGGAWPRQPA